MLRLEVLFHLRMTGINVVVVLLLFLTTLPTETAGFVPPLSSSSPSLLFQQRYEEATTLSFTLSSSTSSCLHFSRTDVPHPNAPNEWGIPTSSSLPPLYGNGNEHKIKPKQLPNGGKVTLVGSGPGDPNLLTVTAYKLLTEANPQTDVIIIDRLVSNEIIQLIPNNVIIKIARKMPGCAELAQEEIYWWMYQYLNQGKHIIRLKIGDPFVFGRGSEEVLMLRKFGVEATIVPVCTL